MGGNLTTPIRPKQEAFARNLAGTPWGMALYHPILRREGEGVGDVGFFNDDGKWIVVCNAFDSEGLSMIPLPRFRVPETHAITTDNPVAKQFKIVVGGNFKSEYQDFGVGGNAPVLAGSGVNAGGTVRFKRANSKGSISVLVHGDDGLVQRACRNGMRWELLRWFRSVEALVWEFVTAHYGCHRPRKIFLVTEQTLTTEYWISHQEHQSMGCAVSIEGEVGIPAIAEGQTYWGYRLRRVQASFGFEVSARKSNDEEERLHSIFFETESSSPINRFRSLKSNSKRARRIENMYRYLEEVERKSAEKRNPATNTPSDSNSNGHTESEGASTTEACDQSGKALEIGDQCNWFLLELSDGGYAIQYTGQKPEAELPPLISDRRLMRILERLYKRRLAAEKGGNRPWSVERDSTSLQNEKVSLEDDDKDFVRNTTGTCGMLSSSIIIADHVIGSLKKLWRSFFVDQPVTTQPHSIVPTDEPPVEMPRQTGAPEYEDDDGGSLNISSPTDRDQEDDIAENSGSQSPSEHSGFDSNDCINGAKENLPSSTFTENNTQVSCHQSTNVQIESDDVASSHGSSDSSPDNNLSQIVARATEQLLSIPSDNDLAGVLPDQPTKPFLVERPISLNELVTHVSPARLFKHLPIHDVISARVLDRSIRIWVDDYFLHHLMPRTEITFRSNYLHSIEGRLEREYEHLTPVIRRIDKEKRFLPHGRVLFEPTDRNPPYYYWHGKFKPVAVDFRLPDGTEYTWDLIPTVDTNSLPHRNDRRTAHLLTIPVFKHQKIYQYYKFETFKDSPAQVFYKDRLDSDAPGFRLHALSFPLKWLQYALYNELGIHKSNRRDIVTNRLAGPQNGPP